MEQRVSQGRGALPYLLALVYAAAYVASFRGQKLWIALPVAVAEAGAGSLQAATAGVTATAVVASVAGAALRFLGGRHGREGGVWLSRAGFALVALPLALTLGVVPGEAFAAAVVLLALVSRGEEHVRGGRQRWKALRRESFPLLAALSFLIFAPSYNALLLTEALLVSAGLSLLVRATVAERHQG